MDVLTPSAAAGWFRGASALRRWALAALLGNVAIIITGAVVRLTASGLGCPTWPQCTADSYVPHGEITHHSLIEFGNRLITFILVALTVATLVTAFRTTRERRTRSLALAAALGIPAQGVIGGITVLTHLNPYVVAFHLLCSVALVAVLTVLVLIAWPAATSVIDPVSRRLVQATFVTLMAAIWVGTVVTGSGPHAGDIAAVRTGLDIEAIAKAHSAVVWLSVGLTLAVCWRLRGHDRAGRWAFALLGAELAQGAIGYAQYVAGLPLHLVILHMAGIGLVTITASGLMFSTTAAATEPAQNTSGSTAAATNTSAR